MEREVLISIVGTQVDTLGETNTIEFVTSGKLYAKQDIYYIVYKETELTGMEGTTTSLKVEKHRVTLNRMGTNASRQVFEKDIYNCGPCKTPYGVMIFGVHPKVVDVNLTDKGGSINLEYELEIDGESISYNTLVLNVKEAS